MRRAVHTLVAMTKLCAALLDIDKDEMLDQRRQRIYNSNKTDLFETTRRLTIGNEPPPIVSDGELRTDSEDSVAN